MTGIVPHLEKRSNVVDLWFPLSASSGTPLNLSADLVRLGPEVFFKTVICESVKSWKRKGFNVRSVTLHNPYGATYEGSVQPDTDPRGGVFVADSWRRLCRDCQSIFHLPKEKIEMQYFQGFGALHDLVSEIKLYLGSISFLANRENYLVQYELSENLKLSWFTDVWGPADKYSRTVCIDSSTIDTEDNAYWLMKDWLTAKGFSLGIEHLPCSSYPHWGREDGANFSMSTEIALKNGIRDGWALPIKPSKPTYVLLNDVKTSKDPLFVGLSIIPLFPGWSGVEVPHASWGITPLQQNNNVTVSPH